MLRVDPAQRPTAAELLEYAWIAEGLKSSEAEANEARAAKGVRS